MSVHDRKNLKSALESAILYLQKQGWRRPGRTHGFYWSMSAGSATAPTLYTVKMKCQKNSRSSTKRWSESAANTFRCSS